jgi:hypothetical protein
MLGEATAAAAAHTTGVMAACTNEVSAGIAAMFGSYGQAFQTLSARSAAFHEHFVYLMSAGGGRVSERRDCECRAGSVECDGFAWVSVARRWSACSRKT